jgi:hypothetical protein
MADTSIVGGLAAFSTSAGGSDPKGLRRIEVIEFEGECTGAARGGDGADMMRVWISKSLDARNDAVVTRSSHKTAV